MKHYRADPANNSKILVLLSGGVDSSYVATTLVEQGYHVSGLYMKMHSHELEHQANLEKIALVAGALQISTNVLDVTRMFAENVYEPFVADYTKGLTPNPCALCNPRVKFGASIRYAMEQGFDYVATGHYVQNDGRFLYRGADAAKDQSYFLFGLNPDDLPRLLFPLGGMQKRDVKSVALAFPFLSQIASGKESQEICFVENSYVDVLQQHVNVDQPGVVLNEKGQEVGTHDGYMRYTVGKRRGFTVHGATEPNYVLQVDSEHNTITVGPKEQLAKRTVVADGLNLFERSEAFEAEVKIRYRSPAIPAQVCIKEGRAIIELDEPAFGVAKGQAAVFYQGERLMGGGWIVDSA